MFNFDWNTLNTSEDENVDSCSYEENFFDTFETDSDDESDVFDFDFGNDDSNNGAMSSGEDDDDDLDNVNFSFCDTISTALILWAVDFGISHSALSALLVILRRFGHKELPKLARTLLRTPKKAIEPRPCGSGEFFYRGIQYNIYQYHIDFLKDCETVEVDLFIDGLSLSDSSKVKMWPIMGSFVNQHTIRPFVIGCYAGPCDPVDVDDFMKELVAELEHLQKNGVEMKNRLVKKFKFFATGTMGHASYFGCPKCNQVCCGMGHKLYYQYFIGELRTDESFERRTDKLHHKPQFQNQASLLERVMGMVSQFVIDVMHGVDLGVTKRISQVIFNSKSLTKAAFAELQARFKSFREYVPSDFARKPRSLMELNNFKATEFRQMLLYTLPVLLKDVLRPELYKNVVKLHVAIRLLSDPSKYKENINAARELIKEFVAEYDDIFGKEHFTFYTHCLLHIPDCVELYGPLYSLSAYKYENHMRVIKRLLRRKHGHLKQFFNRIEEMRFADELRDTEKNLNQCNFNGFKLRPNNLRDGCCMIQPGYPFLITRLFTQNGVEMVRGYRYLECSNFYDDALPSMENMGIILASHLSRTEEDFPASSISHKFFRVPFQDKFTVMEHLVVNKWSIPKSSVLNSVSQQQKYSPACKTINAPIANVPLRKKHPPALARVLQSKGSLNQTNNTQITHKSGDFAIPAPVLRQLKQKNILPIHSIISSSTYIKQQPPAKSTTKRSLASVFSDESRTSSIVPKTAVNVQTTAPQNGSQGKSIKSGRSQLTMQSRDMNPLPQKYTHPDLQKVVAKNKIVPLPSNWKLIKSSSMTSPGLMTPIVKEPGHLMTTIPTGLVPPKIELPTKSTPTIDILSGKANKIMIRVAKNQLIPLPSSWKSVPPTNQPIVTFTENQHKNVPIIQKGENAIKFTLPKVTANIDAMGLNQNIEESLIPKKHSSWFIGSSNYESSSSNELDNSNLKTSSSRALKGAGMIIDSLPNAESNGSLKETVLPLNSGQDTISQFNNSSKRKRRNDSFAIESEHSSDNEEPVYKNKKPMDDNEKTDFEVIMETLKRIEKREIRNSSNIKALVQRMIKEDETAMSFNFPLKTEPEIDKLQECLQRRRFTEKLVTSLENKIARSDNDDILSDLVENVFRPSALEFYTVYGFRGNKSFQKLKINEIFFKLSKLKRKEYNGELTKVLNKMHMRFVREQ